MRKTLKCSSCGSQRTKMDPVNAGKLLCANCGSDKLEYYQISTQSEADAESVLLRRVGAIAAISFIILMAVILPNDNQSNDYNGKQKANTTDSTWSRNKPPEPPKQTSFSDIKSNYDALRFVANAGWDIQTYDRSTNQWINHGTISKVLTSSRESFTRAMADRMKHECLSPDSTGWLFPLSLSGFNEELQKAQQEAERIDKSFDGDNFIVDYYCSNIERVVAENYLTREDLLSGNPKSARVVSVPSEFFSSTTVGTWVWISFDLTLKTDNNVYIEFR